MSSHGPLFDNFRADGANPNGAYADEGYRPSGAPNTLQDSTDRYDAATTGHGVHWDEWTDMPVMPHGPRYDSDFAQPAARAGQHGTWFDVFRGGRTEVKAIIGGLDVFAEVINCTPDYAVVRDRAGLEHEVLLAQIQGFRCAQPGSIDRPEKAAMGGDRGHVTDADYQGAETRSPDAAQAHANGGHLRKSADEDLDVVKGVKVAYAVHHSGLTIGPYCGPCARQTAPALVGGVAKIHTAKSSPTRTCANCGTKVQSKLAKSLDEVLDVAKAMSSERPPLARAQFHHQRGLNAQAKAYRAGYPTTSAGQDHMSDATHHFAQAARYYGEHTGGAPITHSFKTVDEARAHVDAVAKSVDATETALQGNAGATVGHRSGCPRGGDAPCGAEKKGRCSMCGEGVRDHQALGKSIDDVVDVVKALRA